MTSLSLTLTDYNITQITAIHKNTHNLYICAYKNEKLEYFHCNDRFPIKITDYYFILHNYGKPVRKNEHFPQPHGFGNFTTVRHIIQKTIFETTAQLFWIQPEQSEGQQDQPQQPYLMQCQWPHSCNCLIRWALVWSWCLLKVIECDFRYWSSATECMMEKVFLLTVDYSRLSSGVAGRVPLPCFPHLPLMKYIPEFGPCI